MKSVKLFLAYAQEDESYKNKLSKHLAALKEEGYLEEWSAEEILPGSTIDDDIRLKLNQSHIIALLISSDFIACKECRYIEDLAFAAKAKKGTTIVPIKLRPCLYNEAYNQFKMLPDGVKPVTDTAYWGSEDAAFSNIASGIKNLVIALDNQPDVAAVARKTTPVKAAPIKAVSKVAPTPAAVGKPATSENNNIFKYLLFGLLGLLMAGGAGYFMMGNSERENPPIVTTDSPTTDSNIGTTTKPIDSNTGGTTTKPEPNPTNPPTGGTTEPEPTPAPTKPPKLDPLKFDPPKSGGIKIPTEVKLPVLTGIMTFSNSFQHTQEKKTSSNWTILDNKLSNGKADAILFTTPVYGNKGTYLTPATGVWYTSNKWTIFNQNQKTMKTGAQFNIMVGKKSNNVYIHKAIKGNTNGHITTLDHPLLNNKSNARIFVTQNFGVGGPYNNHYIGTYYSGGKWKVFNQDLKKLLVNTQFNVMINNASNTFAHEASKKNTSGHVTTIDSPLTNGKKDAKLIVTQNWGSTGPYNNHQIGVWYSSGKWTIYNQDMKPMPEKAKFNVMVIK